MTLTVRITRDRPPTAWGGPGPVRYWLAVVDDTGRVVWHGGPPYHTKKAAEKAGRAALAGLSS